MHRAPVVFAALLVLSLACGAEREEPAAAQDAAPTEKPEPPLETLPIAVLVVTGFGEIRIALRPDVAPLTVANFQKLADTKFYDGTTFHRVIPSFVIQGGDPNSTDRDPRNDGMGGPGWAIEDEPSGISHRRGVLSMANAGPNTGGSQFFVLVADRPDLDGRHTAFGRVVEGMEVVDRIVAVERDQYGRHGPTDRPLANVVIESIVVEAPRTTPAN
jgi:cyclophilin family peptidyl-prolyl cis-trans isomerase